MRSPRHGAANLSCLKDPCSTTFKSPWINRTEGVECLRLFLSKKLLFQLCYQRCNSINSILFNKVILFVLNPARTFHQELSVKWFDFWIVSDNTSALVLTTRKYCDKENTAAVLRPTANATFPSKISIRNKAWLQRYWMLIFRCSVLNKLISDRDMVH